MSLLSHLPANLLSKPPWVLTWREVRDLQLFVIAQSECLPSESMINLKWRGGGLLWFPNWGSNRCLHMIYLTTDCRLPHTLCLSPSLISLSFNLCISHFVFSPFYALPPYVQTRFISSLFRCTHTWFTTPWTPCGLLSQITPAHTHHPGKKSIHAHDKRLDPSLNGRIWGLLDTDVSVDPRPTTGSRHMLVSHKVMWTLFARTAT